MICPREYVDAWMTTPTVQMDPATNMVLGRPSRSPTNRQERAPRAEPTSKMATTRPGRVSRDMQHLKRLTENLRVVSLRRPLGVDGVDLGNGLEEGRQGGESVHHGLVVPLDEEGHRTQHGDHALEAPALDTADSHGGGCVARPNGLTWTSFSPVCSGTNEVSVEAGQGISKRMWSRKKEEGWDEALYLYLSLEEVKIRGTPRRNGARRHFEDFTSGNLRSDETSSIRSLISNKCDRSEGRSATDGDMEEMSRRNSARPTDDGR